MLWISLHIIQLLSRTFLTSFLKRNVSPSWVSLFLYDDMCGYGECGSIDKVRTAAVLCGHGEAACFSGGPGLPKRPVEACPHHIKGARNFKDGLNGGGCLMPQLCMFKTLCQYSHAWMLDIQLCTCCPIDVYTWYKQSLQCLISKLIYLQMMSVGDQLIDINRQIVQVFL